MVLIIAIDNKLFFSAQRLEDDKYDIKYKEFTIDHPVFRIECDEIEKVYPLNPSDGRFKLICSFS